MANIENALSFLPLFGRKAANRFASGGTEGRVGNASLVSSEEARMAEMLKAANLEHANAVSAPVHPMTSFYTEYGKRAIDIAVAVGACIVLAPLNLVFAACTLADVGMPIFYKQSRMGKDGKEFVLVKFRNMSNAKDADGKLLPAAERITKFGRFMRKYSFDELLNFWSVLKGDMSIIGPRPLPAFFHDRMTERHKARAAVRPGLECPRVVMPEGDNLCLYHIQFENDVWYVENVSLKTDMKMFLMLVGMVFNLGDRDKHARGAAASYFVGYDEAGHALSMNAAKER